MPYKISLIKKNWTANIHLHLAAAQHALFKETARVKTTRLSWLAGGEHVTPQLISAEGCVFAGSDARLHLDEARMRLSSPSDRPWLTDTQLRQTAYPQSLWPRLHRWTSWTLALLSEWSTTRKDDNSASDWTVSNASAITRWWSRGEKDKPPCARLQNVPFVYYISRLNMVNTLSNQIRPTYIVVRITL